MNGLLGPIQWRAPGLAEANPRLTEFVEFLPALNNESDRGMALIATSFIDELLKRILEAFLADRDAAESLLKTSGPLGAFGPRTQLAFALGLISANERHDIDRMRGVRNEFAHKVKVAFSDPKVSKHCQALKFGLPRTAGGAAAEKVEFGDRERFNLAAVTIILRLTTRERLVGQRRLQPNTWST